MLYALGQRNKGSIITFDFRFGYSYISKDKALLVLQSNEFNQGLDPSDGYGTESYSSYAAKRNGISIILSTDRLEGYIDYGIEAIGKEKEGDNEILTGILNIKNKVIGYVKIKAVDDEDWSKQHEDQVDEARYLFNKTNIDFILEDIHKSTNQIIPWLFVSKKILENQPINDIQDNAISGVKVATLADVGMGKSTFTKILYALQVKIYKDVHARKNGNDVLYLYFRGFSSEKKYFCQFLVCDDATYGLPTSSIALEWHIRIRHLMNYATGGTEADKSTGRQLGLVMSCLNFHRITGKAADTAWRDNFKGIFLFSLPSLPWDRNYIRGMLNSDTNYDFLVWLKRERKEASQRNDLKRLHNLLGMGVCITDDENSIPFQFHACNEDWCDIPAFDTLIIPDLPGSSKWVDTWEGIADEIIDKIKEGKLVLTPASIKNEIANIEKREFGIFRRPSEGGINYISKVMYRVKAHFDLVKEQLKLVELGTSNYDKGGNNLPHFDGSRFKLLRNLFAAYWERKGVSSDYSRVLTSYYLWSKQLVKPNSKKKELSIGELESMGVSKLPSKQSWMDWVDVWSNIQNWYQAKSNNIDKYYGIEKTFSTHDGEDIGEAYAHRVLESMIEHLNPPLSPLSLSVEIKYRDKYILDAGKSHDLVVIANREGVAWINHKLFTSSKRIGPKQLDKQFGNSEPPIRILWITYTRPFREVFHISLDNGEWETDVDWTRVEELIEDQIPPHDEDLVGDDLGAHRYQPKVSEDPHDNECAKCIMSEQSHDPRAKTYGLTCKKFKQVK